jgi:deoxyribodipyrimidine photo-lyase
MIRKLTNSSRDVEQVLEAHDLPDVFTTYRKMMEPLREAPRDVLPTPAKGSLPPFTTDVPVQEPPFAIPANLEGVISALHKPLRESPQLENPPAYPDGAQSVHPFKGGESRARTRLDDLILSGAMTAYKETRNGLLGTDFSSKLSAYLALGCITSRQIHESLKAFEDGTNEKYKDAPGYGKGMNGGTESMRFELLWRDYMRLCTRKFGPKLFHLSGFKQKPGSDEKWSSPDRPNGQDRVYLQEVLDRFLNGTTGMGLIDASQRELFHTGYTSNRARQNVASFLAKHLWIDWRYGAEWYESLLIDYDLSSNWGNWQYVSGVGNDPRDEARVFNPVKQSFDYDPQAEYVKTWVPETRECKPAQAFQLWTVPVDERAAKGLDGLAMVERPLKEIHFTVGRRVNPARGRGGGGRGGGGSRRPGNGGQFGPGRGRGGGDQVRVGYGGRGYGSSRGHLRGGRQGGFYDRGGGVWDGQQS